MSEIDDAPRGVKRIFFDLEPHIADRLKACIQQRGITQRAAVRLAVIQWLEREDNSSGKGKGKK